MICSTRSPSLVRRACQEIADEMRAVAGDPQADLSAAARSELAALAEAVEASRGEQSTAAPDTTSPASADGQS